jgi:hypothetical protein
MLIRECVKEYNVDIKGTLLRLIRNRYGNVLSFTICLLLLASTNYRFSLNIFQVSAICRLLHALLLYDTIDHSPIAR